mmetsp:Transcript_13643/g.50848  ORF Transcript_13643/g.50848 Transcript_13643/m.50848 type:complete len:196 (-) Transcript_13643:84-671(-)|eukprot:scaffold1090_cov265-Pinguiococcus_pyrenoidosus.AAC.6
MASEQTRQSSPAPLPEGWTEHVSKKRGRKFYSCKATGETRWERPTEAAPRAEGKRKRTAEDESARRRKKERRRREAEDGPSVEAFHILKKHRGSRRPRTFRDEEVDRSEDEARELLVALRQRLQDLSGPDLREEFSRLAQQESDCRSALRGGSLGSFGQGKMQKAFEEAAFGLQVDELSDVVSTDSGLHIILRVK